VVSHHAQVGIFATPRERPCGSAQYHSRRTLVHNAQRLGGNEVVGKAVTEFTDRVLQIPIIMSRSSANGWLRGTTVRKGGAATNTQRPSQGHVVSTSNTIFGGGVKDPSGRTSEYFVRRATHSTGLTD